MNSDIVMLSGSDILKGVGIEISMRTGGHIQKSGYSIHKDRGYIVVNDVYILDAKLFYNIVITTEVRLQKYLFANN